MSFRIDRDITFYSFFTLEKRYFYIAKQSLKSQRLANTWQNGGNFDLFVPSTQPYGISTLAVVRTVLRRIIANLHVRPKPL